MQSFLDAISTPNCLSTSLTVSAQIAKNGYSIPVCNNGVEFLMDFSGVIGRVVEFDARVFPRERCIQISSPYGKIGARSLKTLKELPTCIARGL